MCVCVCVRVRKNGGRENQGVAPEIRLQASEKGPVHGYVPDSVCRMLCTHSEGFPQPQRVEWQENGGVNYRRP